MVELTDHTQLMNIMIGLSLNIPRWDHSFRDIKYNVETIEPKIPEANPDIIFTNKKVNHSIIMDCKSRTLEEKQIEKYVNLRNNPNILIQHGVVSVPHHEHFRADPTISSYHDLSSIPLIVDNKIPFLHVIRANNRIIKIEKKCAEFQNKEIDKIFPIDTSSGEPPYSLYPFDDNDTEIFTIQILRQLIKYGTGGEKIFTEDELLGEVHPYWSIIHDKKKFKSKAITLLLALLQNGKKTGINRYLSKESKGWKVKVAPDVKSIRAFQNICIKLIQTIDYDTLQETFTE